MNWKVILAILTCNVIFMSASYTMLIPFLPMYLIQDLGVDADHVKIWSGIIFSSTFVVSAIMAPIWGKLSDKKGKKLMAVRSGIGLSIAYFLAGIVSSPTELMFARIAQGFAAGLWPAVLAIMTSYAPKKKLGLSLGVLQGALTAGGVIGPLFGGVLSEYFGMRMSFFCASAALFVISLVLIFFVPEPPKKETAPTVEDNTEEEDNKKVSLFKIPLIRQMIICGGIVQLTILIIQPIITIYIAELHHSMENIVMISGFVFSVTGIAGAIAAPFWGQYGQSRGFSRVLRYGLLGSACVMMLRPFPDSLVIFTILQFILGLFFAAIQPSINAILASNTEHKYQGRLFGLLFSSQQVGSIIGPILGGIVSTFFGLRSVFIMAGILLFGLCYTFYKKREEEIHS